MNTIPGFAADPNLNVSLTFNTTTFLGNNGIRRVINTGASFYTGNESNDTTLQLPAATVDQVTGLPDPAVRVIDFSTPTVALAVTVIRPITVTVSTVNGVVITLDVTRTLILDFPIIRIEFANKDTQNNTQARLTYLL